MRRPAAICFRFALTLRDSSRGEGDAGDAAAYIELLSLRTTNMGTVRSRIF